MRPTLALAGYATPVRGLYLCGSGSHPGGGITCRPGALARATSPPADRADAAPRVFDQG